MKAKGTLNVNGEKSVDSQAAHAVSRARLRAPPVDLEHRRVSLQRQGVG